MNVNFVSSGTQRYEARLIKAKDLGELSMGHAYTQGAPNARGVGKIRNFRHNSLITRWMLYTVYKIDTYGFL